MKTLAVIILLSAIIYLVSDFSGYKNCMSQTKSDYISEKGSKHVAAQCKAFILQKMMAN
tara:strand:+ start:317 stop:493 length:177 start_codon:yes stop_codon:yes gene_type:complete